jgi:hypothetical protein
MKNVEYRITRGTILLWKSPAKNAATGHYPAEYVGSTRFQKRDDPKKRRVHILKSTVGDGDLLSPYTDRRLGTEFTVEMFAVKRRPRLSTEEKDQIRQLLARVAAIKAGA